MRRSDSWFSNKAEQDTRAHGAAMTTLSRTGPTVDADANTDMNIQGQKVFKAGKSVVGEDEVIG